MSPTEDFREFPELEGKTIQSVWSDKNDLGYDFIKIRFTDGTSFEIEEGGQCGYLVFESKV